MPRPPYQPSLLRLLHGATALLVPLTWCTGVLVYSAEDGRWGRLPFTLPGDWIDIHGTVGVALWPIAFNLGDRFFCKGMPVTHTNINSSVAAPLFQGCL